MTATAHELRFITDPTRPGWRAAMCSNDECDWCIPAPGKGTARFQVEHNRHHRQETQP